MVCVGLQAAEKIKVACVGNSITYGYTLDNRERDAYPSQLQRLLGDSYIVGNFGKSGATLLEKGHRPYVKQEEYQQNRERDAYPSQLQRLLGDSYIVGNFGKSGATLLEKGHRPYVKQEEYQQALQFAADIVVIHLGINDTDPRNWPDFRDDFVGDYLRLIDSFKQVNPRSRIIVARLSPIAGG